MARPVPSVEKAIRTAFPAGSKVLAAVSGGADSMVLLRALADASLKSRLSVEVAHLDHALRPTSEADAAFVGAAAAEFGFPFHLRREVPPADNSNIEEWGRQARYRFFAEILARRSLEWTATAHTADDVAETFLMRLVSNKELRTIEARDEVRRVVRPFLGVSRHEVLSFAEERGVLWREDPSNNYRGFLRNRVRHELVPALRTFDPRIVETVAERAAAVASDDRCLDELASGVCSALPDEWGSKAWLRELRAALEGAPEGIKWRIGENLVLSKLSFRIGRSHGLRLAEFILGNGAMLELPGGASVRRREGGIEFSPCNG